ncbi:class I SAM-dependent methyltransferase [Halomonas daqiaonensis]|uniref:class I SAM-dependent methyltransferase n=1 Tax=Halomonas daqiaonensis TaxID=650850 RepID=UPI0011143D79|nr:class I SAM-dependent methyltransferase [Halomonas daqiaonensis]
MSSADNVFDNIELERWGNLKGLKEKERKLIEKYLEKSGPTIEGGTGGGRILFEMEKMGFASLHGFDLSDNMIDIANKRT